MVRLTCAVSPNLHSYLFHFLRNPKPTSQIHHSFVKIPLFSKNRFLSTDLSFELTSIDKARKVFDESPHPETRNWNALLRAHLRARQWARVLHLFRHMNCTRPDRFTISIVIKSCVGFLAFRLGRSLHGFVVKGPKEIKCDVFVGTALVEMYAEFREMGLALCVFDGFHDPDVGLWTSVVSGYLKNYDAAGAVSFFSMMVMEKGASPNLVTINSLLTAIGQLGILRAGRCCHGYVVRRMLDTEVALVNALVNMYANLGSLQNSRNLFDMMSKKDVVGWSCMVSSYTHHGKADEALQVYNKMLAEGFKPNSITITSALQACAVSSNLEEGRRIHKLAAHEGFTSKLPVSTALLDMYMKCECCKEAFQIFHQMPTKDVITWAALIGGYIHNDYMYKAFDAFSCMVSTGMRPDVVVLVKVLQACSQSGFLRQALILHGYTIIYGFSDHIFVLASLIDVYSKCGNLNDAVQVFDTRIDRDLVLWSSMIAGYGIHGMGKSAVALYELMVKASIKPNKVTFISVLSACSHAGLVKDGTRLFDEMTVIYGIEPDPEHYTIMVDLLGRAGKLDEAMDLLNWIPTPVSAHTWCALLAGCRIHRNIGIGKLAAQNLLELDPNHSGYHRLLPNMYSFGGEWDYAPQIKSLGSKVGPKKVQGYSSVEVSGCVCSFLSNERSHEQWGAIQQQLLELEVNMREEGN